MNVERTRTGGFARNLVVLGLGAAALGAQGVGGQDGATGEVAVVREIGATRTPRRIDLAICLDTSGSMKGLIDSARQKIWSIVNDLALAEPEPELYVALVAYGGEHYDPARGWVQVMTPLTRDLDLVSQRLFELAAEGSTEYVGRVLHTATQELEWGTEPGSLKLIVVAGNESADQDRAVPFRDACARAIARDITVDAIYCGPPADEIAPLWREVARLSDGHFASIDKDQGTVVVSTPYDGALGELSSALNGTYLPYGAQGRSGLENQWAQDANVAGLNGEAIATRATCKASNFYCNSMWDLVDASSEPDFDLGSVDPATLPEGMQAMSPEERSAHVESMRARRAEIQSQITALSARRNAFAAVELSRLSADQSLAFDAALRASVRAKAHARGFRFAGGDTSAAGVRTAALPQSLCPELEALLPADVRLLLPLDAIPACLRAGVPHPDAELVRVVAQPQVIDLVQPQQVLAVPQVVQVPYPAQVRDPAQQP